MGQSYIGTDVPRLLSAALWGAAPAWWNRADGERMRRSCMSSSPSLAEGDIWHHLAQVALWCLERAVFFFFFFYSGVVQGCWWEVLWVITIPPYAPSSTNSSSILPLFLPPLSIKVNKGFQQRANEHGPLSRDACLCCLPPRTLLVYLGCQVKGRLREGETFFFFFLIRPALFP